MSRKVGENIMVLAQVLAWLAGFASVITAIGLWGSTERFGPGFLALISGVVVVVSCWPLYGFGMLIDDVHAMRVRGSAAAAPVAEEVADELPDL